MLTAIEIENFKAFGERQRIELRPITLLFGPNSGGKSTVTHALHYLREVLAGGALDAHRTWSGGDVLDLGGIRNFVHGRRLGSIIKLKAEFTLDGPELPYYSDAAGDVGTSDEVEEAIRGLIETAAVEIEIDTAAEPEIRRLVVALNGVHFAELVSERARPHSEVRSLNWHHPVLLLTDEDWDTATAYNASWVSGAVLETATEEESTKERDEQAQEPTRDHFLRVWNKFAVSMFTDGGGERDKSGVDAADTGEGSAQPAGVMASLYAGAGMVPEARMRLAIPRFNTSMLNLKDPLVLPSLAERPGPDEMGSANRFARVLSMLLLGPAAVLSKRLEDFRYVGPLRSMPPRHFEPRHQSGRSRWPSGAQAWDDLVHGSEAMLKEASRWLEAEECLDTGYRLERESLKPVPSRFVDMLADSEWLDEFAGLRDDDDAKKSIIAQLLACPEQVRIVLRDVGRNLLLQPQDVGVGLSQIVPVMVALLAPAGPLVALEQPELHLHPRQQAALGDALIKGMSAMPNRVLLVETHSEHLILRILRRIRETNRKGAPAGQSLTPDQLRIQYVRREGSVSRAQTIDVDVNGDLVDPWPDDFFEQDFKERFS